MFATANTYTLTLPDNEDIVFGPDKTASDWVALVGQNGITSSVEVRESRAPIGRADGEIIGYSYWGSRSIVIDLFLPYNDPQERADALAKLQRCTKMLREPGTLSWTEQDTAGTEKQIPVYLQSFPTITHSAGPSKTVQITLLAQQPHIEGATLLTLSNAARDTNHTVNNPGDWDTYPIITVTTPFSASAKIENLTTGETMTFTTAFLSSAPTPPATTPWANSIVINTNPNNRQAFYYQGSSATNFYGYIDVSSEFLRLAPGNNTIKYTPGASGTADSKISLDWRGAWM